MQIPGTHPRFVNEMLWGCSWGVCSLTSSPGESLTPGHLRTRLERHSKLVCQKPSDCFFTGWGFSMGTSYHFHSWRVFVIVCALPCAVSMVALRFMPESPRFLLEVSQPPCPVAVAPDVGRPDPSLRPASLLSGLAAHPGFWVVSGAH